MRLNRRISTARNYRPGHHIPTNSDIRLIGASRTAFGGNSRNSAMGNNNISVARPSWYRRQCSHAFSRKRQPNSEAHLHQKPEKSAYRVKVVLKRLDGRQTEWAACFNPR